MATMTDSRPSIAELQQSSDVIDRRQWSAEVAALVNAAPVLLEIAAAAMAWRDQRFANLQAALLRTESEIEAEQQEVSRDRRKRTAELASAIEAVLAKVRP